MNPCHQDCKVMYSVVISCVFPPEPVISSQTSFQVAECLLERGHDVLVITSFPSRPAGKLYQGYSRKLFQRQQADRGVQVLRCFSKLSGASTLLSRFAENISFGITSALALAVIRRPNVLYVNTWPLFAMGLVVIVAKLRGIPLVLSIQDVYPEVLVSQGRLNPKSWIVRWLECLDRAVVNGAEAVAVISDSFRQIYLCRGIPVNRLHLVPNWVDDAGDDLNQDGRHFRQRLGIPENAFLTVYGGNISTAAGVEMAIEAFARVALLQPNMYFCVAGAGASLETCRKLVQRIDCDRVLFYSPWPTTETSEVLAAADLLLLPTLGAQSLASVPSKLINYMLAARPILALGLPESDLASVVKQAGAGWIVAPDNVAALAEQWRIISQLDHSTLNRYGRAGRDFALGNMTKEACLPRLLDIIEAVGHREIYFSSEGMNT